jgi:hypothetical protein
LAEFYIVFNRVNEIINDIVGKRKREEDTILSTELPALNIENLFEDFDNPTLEQFTDVLSSDQSLDGKPFSMGTDPKKKKTENKAKNTSKSRIPSSDIRRDYGRLISRAFNTCDKNILEKVLENYCTPDVVCSYKYIGIRFPYGCEDISIVGAEALLKFWEVIILSAPDGIFQIQESKFRSLGNGTCLNISKYVYHCTKIFWMSIDESSKATLYKDGEKDIDSSSNNSSNHNSGRNDIHSNLPQPPPLDSVFLEENSVKSENINDNDQRILASNIPKKPLLPHEDLSNLKEVAGKKPGLSAYRYGDQSHVVPSVANIQNRGSDFGLGNCLQTPVTLIFIGTMTLFINQLGRIYKFEFMHSLKP